jgi:AraC-like DNA-binding protein
MAGAISNLRFEYMNTSERRVLNLGEVGLPAVPMLGYCNYRNPRPDVPEHWHPGCVEIHFGVRNAVSFGFNGRVYRLGPSEVFVNLPGERHTVSEHPKGLILYWLILRLESGTTPLLGQPPKEAAALRQALLHIPHHHFRGTETLKRLFQSLHMLVDEPASPLRTLRLRTATLQLLMEVLSAANSHTVPPDESRLETILCEMRNHPERPFPLENLSRQAGMAPNHFIARFRNFTGLPPRQFLLDCRMRAACRLLRETSAPVTEIAFQLGFCSSQHFASLFKRHTGATPLACRAGDAGPRRASDRDDGQSLKQGKRKNLPVPECAAGR